MASLGFGNRTALSHRKSQKRGFEFSLMVVGESGLGKSTLINSLFATNIYAGREIPPVKERLDKTVHIDVATVEIEERGVRLKLTIVDTPGFADSIDSTNCITPIVDYVDKRFESYFRDESGLNRRNISDSRVHCCFYFINPSAHGLRPIDIKFMKALHEKVNLVPIIAKADTLTKKELVSKKKRILEEIRKNEIILYELPECDSDEDEDYKRMTQALQENIPYAVIGSNCIEEIKGKKVRVRQYPWGIVEVENEEHSDFAKLRTMLITYMQDLKDVTGDFLYESYRAQKLSGTSGSSSLPRHRGRAASVEKIADEVEKDKDRMLREKEEELRRMQEMIAKIQEQMRQQQLQQQQQTVQQQP